MISRKSKIIIILVAVILAISGAGAGIYYYETHLVYETSRVEAGVEVSIADLLMRPDDKASFAEGSDTIDTTVPGTYYLKIKTGWFVHPATLIVEDTIAPELEVKNLNGGYGESLEAAAFVKSVSDATKVTISFEKEPDFKQDGDQTVTICATDLGGNVTKKEAILSLCPVKTELEVEAGSEVPTVEAFLLDTAIEGAAFMPKTEVATTDGDATGDTSAETTTTALVVANGIEEVDMSHVGTYGLGIAVGENTYGVTLKVVDTVAPVITVQNLTKFVNVSRKPEDFVTGVSDATTVTYSFETEPNLKQEGEQSLVIHAVDEGGNEVTAPVTLTLQADTEAPVINGAADQTVYEGSSIAYRSIVSATDNDPEGLSFNIDSSNVNLKAAGDYPVYCTATDASGNSTSASFTVHVIVRTYSEAEVYALADAALANCINSGMSQYDKAAAIFWYVRNNMHYYDSSDKSSWLKAAAEAFTNHKGDCYSYACMSKAMLTRAGITNMDIGTLPGNRTLHYWNLVDLGDGHGWYHFDTTPRRDNPTPLCWTDAQISTYSASHLDCYNYDRSAYPAIP